jgi:FKBP-type peptidyl-prolyl cis-trans isomerase
MQIPFFFCHSLQKYINAGLHAYLYLFLLHMKAHVLLFGSLLMGYACTPEKPKPSAPKLERASEVEAVKKQFIKANQQLIQKENDEMDYYAKTHKMPFKKTGSGVRYFVYNPSEKGDSIRANTEITMQYTLSLLDGTICYSSARDGKKTFIVEHENLESGIHKGVQYLKKGDQALFLIPSHLAHGLLGDLNKVPPQMPIVYDVKIDK